MQLPPDAEQEWLRLVNHLDLSEGFSIVLLTSPTPRVLAEVQRCLRERTAQGDGAFAVLEPLRDAQWRLGLAPAAATAEAAAATVWVSLDGLIGDEAADELRRQALQTLNVARTTLERTAKAPLVVALPAGWLPRVWEVAPDLWAVRDFVGEFPGVLGPVAEQALELEPEVAPEAATGGGVSAAVAAWRRLAQKAVAEPERVDPWVALAAVDALRDAGDSAGAMVVAAQAEALARARVGANDTPQRQLALIAALDSRGVLAVQAGDFASAARYSLEGLELRRALTGHDPASVQARRDLAASLSMLGDIALRTGDSEAAARFLGDCLEIRRALVAQDPASAQARRDLSVSLERLGTLHTASGDAAQGATLLTEAVAQRRSVLALDPTMAQFRRELAVCLLQASQAAAAAGDATAAIAHLTEAAVLADGLCVDYPDHPDFARVRDVTRHTLTNLQAAGSTT